MIPYLGFTNFSLGPLTIQVWGLMVALGIFLGAKASTMLAKKRGQDPKIIWELTSWIILSAFIFARGFHILFYEPMHFFQNPTEIFAIWNGGLSITGGFIGALVVTIWYLRRKQVDVYAYADTTLFGLPLGLFIGRIGCFLIHDHPGTATDFIMGVEYPDGVTRHDHGLYLSINGLILFLAFLALAKRKAETGTYIIVFLIWYGIMRFFLDFLRATDGLIADQRYFGLTPAQYFSLAMVLAGLIFWKRKKPT